jgi:PTH2 family peptidyl-tRNA hydrolase
MSWLTRRLSWISVGTDERPHVLSGFFTEPEYQWITGNFRKITCQVSSLEALMQVHADAIDAGLEARVITDAGLTEFHGQPTITAIAIGPDYDEKIDPITGHLELY